MFVKNIFFCYTKSKESKEFLRGLLDDKTSKIVKQMPNNNPKRS